MADFKQSVEAGKCSTNTAFIFVAKLSLCHIQLRLDEEETYCSHFSESKEDSATEAIITGLESILFDDKFTAVLNAFYEKNCGTYLAFLYTT
jgi:hypothetical protein